MNLAPLLRFPALMPVAAVPAPPPRRRAKVAITWFVVSFFALNLAAYVVIDASGSNLRDPEYGRRLTSLRQRIAENPDRPLVLVVGSSRASMGVRPTAWEEARPGGRDPLLFNMSLVGSGPVMELMCLRRLYVDGIRPAAVVLEYWPPFLREDGPYYEPARIDHVRLRDADRQLVRDYFFKPDETERLMRRDRLNPLYETRQRLIAQVLPRWQPWDKRIEMSWGTMDGWGWLAGLDEPFPPDPETRSKRVEHCETIYRAQFNGYSIHPIADRALRESVALARSHGANVALVWLPEANEFRSWIPPDAERMAQEHLTRLRQELDVPLIDARRWMADGYLVDGFHLSRLGAAEFTKRFGPAVSTTFPELRGP
jgi:hypothetical protein